MTSEDPEKDPVLPTPRSAQLKDPLLPTPRELGAVPARGPDGAVVRQPT